jgi:hypothetical protein
MKEEGIDEIELIEAEMEAGTGYFYCTQYGECGIVGESCGKFCDEYKPRNGKNGRCRFSANTYEQTEKHFTLKTNQQ